ncbi:hypothetical protein E6P78_30980 [Streptomyces sp. A0958]|uniref:hypothetical protein n=1 Tax=unclassified Streptomyces TaxID=2593676 RepID=UPI00081B447E|nr:MULTISPECIES: hypothetical protein [unclassified Streptomyces]THA57756.1 hypothetical protein E6P78_30980 [Streptomyces sp. A0958]SCD47165.1 hypothetical protein GA0115239_102231 [Streptomyces sp. BpilaLS-43]
MTNVLVVYDRSAGRLLREEQYDRRQDALRARFATEREFKGRSNVEVVVLGANNRNDLLKTHARYFLGLDELAARMA